MANLGIKDIAAMANVSPATVSRVLSSPDLVSPKTLNKVKKIIDESGYRPNRLGASLRTRKSGNIVAIIPTISKPVNSGIIRAIEKEAQDSGYSVLLGDTQGIKERVEHYASMVEYGQADGILLFSNYLPFDIKPEKDVNQQIPPLVNANEMATTPGLNTVFIDNEGAAIKAMEHLLSLGHTRIAAITGPSNVPSSNERLAGYHKALENHGIEVDPKLIIESNYDLQGGVDSAADLLQLRDRPTAIFAFSDDMAIGLMNVLQANGFSVPDDISVMGFDDISYSKFVTPSLTTVHQPVTEIGVACAKLLINLIKNPDRVTENVELNYTLQIRNSTGPVPS